jgi:hypothetical protein
MVPTTKGCDCLAHCARAESGAGTWCVFCSAICDRSWGRRQAATADTLHYDSSKLGCITSISRLEGHVQGAVLHLDDELQIDGRQWLDVVGDAKIAHKQRALSIHTEGALARALKVRAAGPVDLCLEEGDTVVAVGDCKQKRAVS